MLIWIANSPHGNSFYESATCQNFGKGFFVVWSMKSMHHFLHGLRSQNSHGLHKHMGYYCWWGVSTAHSITTKKYSVTSCTYLPTFCKLILHNCLQQPSQVSTCIYIYIYVIPSIVKTQHYGENRLYRRTGFNWVV